MDKIDIIDCLKKLSDSRPIFHSEDDFNHSLAMELDRYLNKTKSNYSIRFETPIPIQYIRRGLNTPQDFFAYIDILIINSKKEWIPIEIKYKTKKLAKPYSDVWGVEFNPKNHSAADVSRYDIRKDIFRLEQLLNEPKVAKGFSIFLTNEPNYWNLDIDRKYMDGNYRLAKIIQQEDKGWLYDSVEKYYDQKEGKLYSKTNDKPH